MSVSLPQDLRQTLPTTHTLPYWMLVELVNRVWKMWFLYLSNKGFILCNNLRHTYGLSMC